MPVRKTTKQKIMERIPVLLNPLIAEQGIRKIERKRTLFLLEPLKPAIHYVAGPEIVLEEDNRGYRMEFGLFFKLMVADARNLEDEVDKLVGFIQEKLESDPQLTVGEDALAIKVKYDGEQPFGEDVLKPEGGTVIAYVIEYRRYIGEPQYNY